MTYPTVIVGGRSEGMADPDPALVEQAPQGMALVLGRHYLLEGDRPEVSSGRGGHKKEKGGTYLAALSFMKLSFPFSRLDISGFVAFNSPAKKKSKEMTWTAR